MEDYDRCLNARPKETCLISIFQGTSGKKNWNNYWLQENAKKRKTMMDKWLKDPASVGDASTSGGEVTPHTLAAMIISILNSMIPGHGKHHREQWRIRSHQGLTDGDANGESQKRSILKLSRFCISFFCYLCS